MPEAFIPLTFGRRISAAIMGPKRCHQKRTVLWLASIPRSCRRSSTFRSNKGNRTYSIIASRMISRLVRKYWKGLRLVRLRGYADPRTCSTVIVLKAL
jgi:hypothetical protein